MRFYGSLFHVFRCLTHICMLKNDVFTKTGPAYKNFVQELRIYTGQ